MFRGSDICLLAELCKRDQTQAVSRRAKFVTLMTCASALIATIVIFRITREPTYQGRSLYDWLTKSWDYEKDIPISPEEAAAAVRAIGTKEIPTILKWMTCERKRGGIRPIIEKLPIIGPAYMQSIENEASRSYAAEQFFKIMGNQAAPAIPELTRMATKHPDQYKRLGAAYALQEIGEEALPGIAAYLETPEDPERRHFAFRLLIDDKLKHYTNTSVLVQPLIHCTASPDADLAIYAMEILRKLPIEKELVLPVMTNALRSADKRIRQEAFIHSWRMGYTEAARLALSDPDPDVRTTATNVLGTNWIASQIETNQTRSPR